MTAKTQTQATIIEQVRDQLGGTLTIPDADQKLRTYHMPIRGVRFFLHADPNTIEVVKGRTRKVSIAYDNGPDLYNVTITDFDRAGTTIVSERTFEGVYADTLGELVNTPRLRKPTPPADTLDEACGQGRR